MILSLLCVLSHVQFFFNIMDCLIPTLGRSLGEANGKPFQVPLFMAFSRQGYWNGLPFASPGDLPNVGIKPISPALADGFFAI